MVMRGLLCASTELGNFLWEAGTTKIPPVKECKGKLPYGLEFGVMIKCTMKRISIWNGKALPMFAFSDRPSVMSCSESLLYSHALFVRSYGALQKINFIGIRYWLQIFVRLCSCIIIETPSYTLTPTTNILFGYLIRVTTGEVKFGNPTNLSRQ